ncbi:hypothetical protein ZIOFF_018480 [Zingiber officinale]|uniref:Uncharacterized protein n=1 Tax=Zingiber officinale TaxID=94328 RepID=A0A8J5H6E6_ZINOF|nr:hypothetical protein ZIOFF_018480 [Zingiber officinale]
MLGEVLDAFRSLRLRSFVNYTLGAAGHYAAVHAHLELELFVGMDMDASIHDQARARIEKLLAVDSHDSKLKAYTHVRNFKYIKSVLGGVDENLLDVGLMVLLPHLNIADPLPQLMHLGSNLYFWIAIIPVTVDTLLIVCVVSAHQIKEGMGYL